MNYSIRETKLKKEKKKKFSPFMPFTLQAQPQRDLHPKASYSYGNPQLWHPVQVRVSSPRVCLMHSLTNPHYSLLSCTILLAFLASKYLFLKHSLMVSIYFFHSLPTEQLPTPFYIDSVSKPIILHPLHMAKPPKYTFINPFIYPLLSL